MFHFQLVSISGKKFDEDVYEVVLPTLDGQIGVFQDHMPLVSVATAGAIMVPARSDEGWISFRDWKPACAGGESGSIAPDPNNPDSTPLGAGSLTGLIALASRSKKPAEKDNAGPTPSAPSLLDKLDPSQVKRNRDAPSEAVAVLGSLERARPECLYRVKKPAAERSMIEA